MGHIHTHGIMQVKYPEFPQLGEVKKPDFPKISSVKEICWNPQSETFVTPSLGWIMENSETPTVHLAGH